MIEIDFIGAAQTVTGSKHVIRTSRAKVLLDCGLFQGHRKDAYAENKNLPIKVEDLDAVVLSHAHIDHSGALPSLYKKGYRGPIYATPATRDLCLPMLLDTAFLMKSDAIHLEKIKKRGARHIDILEPLYNETEVRETIALFQQIPYREKQNIAPGIDLTFLDAGHVLGSAICVLDIEDQGTRERLVFTGDIGRKHLPILNDPEIPTGTTCLIMESTYGDRLHDPVELLPEELSEIIRKTISRKGKIVIPSFALERAQEIIFSLKKLRDLNHIPKVPVYVDSPLTVKITDVFKKHPECFDEITFAELNGKNSPFEFAGLEYISDVEDSKRISTSDEPCIIISASGMCEGGRILHHLQATVEDKKNTVLIVGYQAENTLGRRIVEKREEIKIFGTMFKLESEVCILNGFSAHADQIGLLGFAEAVKAAGSLKTIFLVHGDLPAQESLKGLLEEKVFSKVVIPKKGDQFKITGA